jgi:glycosyltransferase involved in cell wall biosynthesis
MACGAPAVAASVGNIPQLAGGAALLFRPGDPAEFGRAITAVLGDDDLRLKLRAAGPERARGLTWAKAAALTSKIYRNVASG